MEGGRLEWRGKSKESEREGRERDGREGEGEVYPRVCTRVYPRDQGLLTRLHGLPQGLPQGLPHNPEFAPGSTLGVTPRSTPVYTPGSTLVSNLF